MLVKTHMPRRDRACPCPLVRGPFISHMWEMVNRRDRACPDKRELKGTGCAGTVPTLRNICPSCMERCGDDGLIPSPDRGQPYPPLRSTSPYHARRTAAIIGRIWRVYNGHRVRSLCDYTIRGPVGHPEHECEFVH